jgi:hypothetical protein
MNRLRAFGLLALCGLPALVYSGGQPGGLEFLRQGAPMEFRYTETRRLELMAEPWKGSGYLYSTPEGTLVKLQTAPERLIMAIVDDAMIYYESASRRRQSAPLSYAGPMAEQIKAFRAIIQGRLSELETAYVIQSKARGSQWTLRLESKSPPPAGAPVQVEMSGEHRKRRILLRQGDGDQTEYLLEQGRQGPSLELPIRQLISEAKGK